MKSLITTLCIIISTGLLQKVFAQDIWSFERSNSIALEMLKPGFDRPGDLSISSAVWFLSGSYSLTERLSIKAEIPFVHVSFGDEVSESTIGNISAKIRYSLKKHDLNFEGGIFIPTTSDQPTATTYANLADFNRVESFDFERYGISSHATFQYNLGKHFFVGARSGFLYQVEKDNFGNGMLFLDYNFMGGYYDDIIIIKAGLTGRMLISSEGDFEISKSRAVDQFGFSIAANTGRIRPGISLRIPMDTFLEQFLNNTIGFHLDYIFQ